MKFMLKRIVTVALLGLMLPLVAQADMPGQHPYYLHALSDLRTARWLLAHRPGDPAVEGQEGMAVAEIDRAIHEIQHAAIDDGKDIYDHEPVDDQQDHPGRLHKAVDLLHRVHHDIVREEDDPMTRGLRDRAIMHVDAATRAAEQALVDRRY